MDKPNETAETNTEPEAPPPWGTWEELLLSCAVHRHGTDSWDSVAIEIQKRSSTTSTLHLTPSHCKQKYVDLKQRYSPPNDAVNEDKADDAVPWLDELRKLRVAELRREVERSDLSIVSLQLKVKRLEEEREEEGLRGGEDKSDPEKTVDRGREDEQNREGGITPESVAGEPVSGGDNLSVNESNFSDPNKVGKDGDVKEPEPVRTGVGEPDTGEGGGSTKPVGENSCNGSSNSIEKEEDGQVREAGEEGPVRKTVKDEPGGGRGDSPELWESVAESKGGGEEVTAVKESSDVQSSASKSRKELGDDDKVRSGCVSGDEPEDVDQSLAVKPVSVESRSLVEFLEIVRSHKLGSVFQRRLERQETPEYKNMIRQHIDLETMQTRLKEGWYLSFNSSFYRDLLLLFNNAILFFGKESKESVAAIELRQLVFKEMARTNLKFNSSAEEQTLSPSLLLSSKPEPEPSSDSLLLKPKMIPGSMIVCRKRSSIAAKALGGSSSSGGADRKREQKAEEKPILDWKQPNKKSSGNNAEENNRVTKKRTTDRFASAGSRSSKKDGKNRSNPNPSKTTEPLSSELSEPKSEKSTHATSTVSGGAKKRSAANFLSRMKRSSTTTNDKGSALLDTLKSSGISSSMNTRGGGGEQKRSGGNGKGGDGKKEQAVTSRRGSGGGGRQVKEKEKEKEQGSPTKRNVGRPPRRAAAPPPSTPAAVSGKRSREGGGGGDKEAGGSRQPKKRSRR
ncbi:hypothetical protein Vadar_034769 [Vaccinium darrowii]|uniref:Uncharacterized protein n=1 Tax=Vaccinium darrowii TaxID=229202 RepID=A0ACB7YSR4_9ERIC|nr:hypothetical protein Vadar_034769 [Vaccinium darrowii]